MTVSSHRGNPVTLDEFVTGLFIAAKLAGRRSFRVDRSALVTGMIRAGHTLERAGSPTGPAQPVELANTETAHAQIVAAVLRAVERGTLAFDPTGQGDGRIRVALSTQECDLLADQIPGGVNAWTQAAATFARVFAETAPHKRPRACTKALTATSPARD